MFRNGATGAAAVCGSFPRAGQGGGSAPAWFENAAENEWTEVPTTNVLTDVMQGTIGDPFSFGGAITVDQTNKELVHAAGGGHQDGSSNQVCVLDLSAEAPAWTHVWGPSASPSVGGGWDDHAYPDGEPRSVHAWGSCCWADGNIVYPTMQGMYNNGTFSSAIYTFNRAAGNGWTFRGLALADPHGVAGNWNYEASPACYDSHSDAFYVFITSQVGWGVYRVNNGTWTVDDYNIQTSPSYRGHSWAFAVPEDHYVVTNGSVDGALYIIDSDDPGAGFTQKVPTGTGETAFGAGCVYHPGTKAAYAWDDSGASVFKLSVPADGDFVNGTFAWSELTGGLTAPPNWPNASGYTAFNIVEDMGNGQSALVLFTSPNGAVYAWKLP